MLRLRPRARPHLLCARRAYSLQKLDPSKIERAQDDVDVLIVGAGPAGLSAAIRLKQLQRDKGGDELRVVVLEKGSEVGAHILSGAVLEPRSLTELLPNWQSLPGCPITQPTTSSSMIYLTNPDGAWASSPFKGVVPLPHPPQMSNKGNYVISLSEVVRWLGAVAEEEYGVEIYPGFGGAELVFSEDDEGWLGESKKRVVGVRTNDVGLSKEYEMKDGYEPGMEFRAKVTLLAEGGVVFFCLLYELTTPRRTRFPLKTFDPILQSSQRLKSSDLRDGNQGYTFL